MGWVQSTDRFYGEANKDQRERPERKTREKDQRERPERKTREKDQSCAPYIFERFYKFMLEEG